MNKKVQKVASYRFYFNKSSKSFVLALAVAVTGLDHGSFCVFDSDLSSGCFTAGRESEEDGRDIDAFETSVMSSSIFFGPFPGLRC